MVAKLLEEVEQVLCQLAKTEINHADLIHHSGMYIVAWMGVKYAPGGSSMIFQVTKQHLSFYFKST